MTLSRASNCLRYLVGWVDRVVVYNYIKIIFRFKWCLAHFQWRKQTLPTSLNYFLSLRGIELRSLGCESVALASKPTNTTLDLSHIALYGNLFYCQLQDSNPGRLSGKRKWSLGSACSSSTVVGKTTSYQEVVGSNHNRWWKVFASRYISTIVNPLPQ